MEFIVLKPCPKCGGKIEGYSSGSKFIFFMRCVSCEEEYPLKTPIVLCKNSATKITKSSIGRAFKEWNAMTHKENRLSTQADRETLQEATKEAKAQMNQADYLLEMCAGVYSTGLNKPYTTKAEMLRLLLHEAQRAAELQAKIDSGEMVEVVHAQWIWADDEYLRCSKCNQKAPVVKQYQDEAETVATNYCPNCGARMDFEDSHDQNGTISHSKANPV